MDRIRPSLQRRECLGAKVAKVLLRYSFPLPLSWLEALVSVALESLALVLRVENRWSPFSLSLHLCVLRILVDAYRKFSRLIPLSGARVSRLAESR